MTGPDRSTIWPYRDGEPGEFYYSRYDHPAGVEAERALGKLEGGHALLFASGAAASTAAVLGLLAPGKTIALAEGCYYGTSVLFRALEPWGVRFVEFDVDLDNRTAHLKVGDGIVETESETMRGIDPPEPYQVIVKIPNGFEYTGPDESAETAKATRIVSNGAVKLDLTDSHSSIAWVRHGSSVETGAHPVAAARAT